MSLKQFLEKIKPHPKFLSNLGWGGLIIMVIFSSYGLGKISNLEKDRILIQKNAFSIDFVEEVSGGKTGNIVASKNGTKYYFSWCSGVNRIKPENRVYFSTEESAKSRGYERAKNC